MRLPEVQADSAFKALDNDELVDAAKQLTPKIGHWRQTTAGYVYLSVEEAFVKTSFIKARLPQSLIPNYFTPPRGLGAHISVIYEREGPQAPRVLPDAPCSFEIGPAYEVTTPKKTYFVFLIAAPEVVELRQRFGLGYFPRYRSILLPLHLTFAIRPALEH